VDKPLASKLILYRWALDEMGFPAQISQAVRGRHYTCPLCHSPMIARLGEELQHHFSHEQETGCTSEAVTRAALGRWITLQLRDAVQKHQVAKVEWTCARCGKSHSADVLAGGGPVHEGYQWGGGAGRFADVALLDTAGNVLMAILIQDDTMPTRETLDFLRGKDAFTVVVPASVTPAGSDFRALLTMGEIVGAACPVLKQVTNIIREGDAIRQALRDVVSRWPGYFYGALESVDGLSNVLKLDNAALWLPPEQWREFIGGTRNPLAPGIQVTMKEWPHHDGGTIMLYYASVRDTGAVGVKRYGPGQVPTPYIDHRFRNRNVTALDIIYYLVMQ